MDPLTQGALGAAATLAMLSGRVPFSAKKLAWMGALGGMAPDLDVLIRSDEDPLLAIKFHRHFTHSFAFIPVGGVVAALPWLLAPALRAHTKWVIAATTIGYATHALLDACTTYGTLLLWPFSDLRVSWRWISVVDPLFTLPLLGCVVAAASQGAARWARAGLLWGSAVLALGIFQQWRAEQLQARLASERGHSVQRAAVFPMFMNNVTWRSLYQSGDRYYVDKLRLTLTGKACATPGTSVPIPDNPLDDPTQSARMHPTSARAHRLIRWFSNGWVALDPQDASVVGDLRYSFSPTEAVPIWGVRVVDTTGEVEWVNNRSRRDVELGDLVKLVTEDGPGHRCY